MVSSWAFSVLTLTKWSHLTNTSKPSREPLLLLAKKLAIFWRTDWMGMNTSMICAVPFTLRYCLCFCRPHTHTQSLSPQTRPLCYDNVTWHQGPGMMCVIFHTWQHGSDIGLACFVFVQQVYCFKRGKPNPVFNHWIVSWFNSFQVEKKKKTVRLRLKALILYTFLQLHCSRKGRVSLWNQCVIYLKLQYAVILIDTPLSRLYQEAWFDPKWWILALYTWQYNFLSMKSTGVCVLSSEVRKCRLIRAWKGKSRTVWGNNFLVPWNEPVIAPILPKLSLRSWELCYAFLIQNTSESTQTYAACSPGKDFSTL